MLDSGSRTRVRGLVLAAVCAAALGLAACGDDDDDTATTDTTATEATTDTEATTSEDTTTEDAETSEDGETTEDAATSGDIGEVLRSQLEAAGIPTAQVDCVVDELESTLGEDTLEELQSTDTPSQEVIDASTDAAQKCLTP